MSKPTPMRFRVVPHSSGGEYHVIEYKTGGFFSLWKRLIDPWMLYDNPRLWEWDHPMMFHSSEAAVEYAKTLDAAKVEAFLAEKRVEWNRRWAEVEKVRTGRCKTIYL